jgi:hypothetical protein
MREGYYMMGILESIKSVKSSERCEPRRRWGKRAL